jgi:hypothetical protein
MQRILVCALAAMALTAVVLVVPSGSISRTELVYGDRPEQQVIVFSTDHQRVPHERLHAGLACRLAPTGVLNDVDRQWQRLDLPPLS